MNSTGQVAACLRRLSLAKNLRVNSTRYLSLACQRCKSAKEELDDKPIEFTKSEASRTIPHYLNERVHENPTSRTISFGISMIAFCLWFFVLREESDWDQDVTRSLYDRMGPDLEKTNLITAITYYQRHQMDPTPLIRRLKEIEDEEAAANAEGKDTEARLVGGR